MCGIRPVMAIVLAAGAGMRADAAHPLLTEDTGTQGLGNAQLELMIDRTRDRLAGIAVREQLTTAVLSYGIREHIDLQFGLPHVRQHAHDALGRHAEEGVLDASVDVKWRFFERGDFSLGLKSGLTLPTGDKNRGHGAGRVNWGALLALSHEQGRLAFHSHYGYRRNDNALGQRTSLRHLSGALTYMATARLKLVADLSADTDPDRARDGSLRYRILGLIYSPTPALDLDAGLKRGHGRAAADRALLFGATLRW